MSSAPIVLHPTYFPNIEGLGILFHRSEDVLWEAWDNYQKQTFRNRCTISTDQGRLNLNIPIRHLGEESGRQRYRDVRMDEASGWRELHWKTLQNAYRSSPYFEYYEDDLRKLYVPGEASDRLYDFNLKTIEFLCSCLDVDLTSRFTEVYEERPEGQDGRYLVVAKHREPVEFPEYVQVFQERHGFISNLSALDLVFNLGPEGSTYLRGLPSYSDFF